MSLLLFCMACLRPERATELDVHHTTDPAPPDGTGPGTLATRPPDTGTETADTGLVWFADDFEDGLGPAWLTGGAHPWHPVRDGLQGSTGVSSGAIDSHELSLLELSLDFATSGTLEFWHKGSTEAGYDPLTFWIDDQLVLEQSGSWSWQREVMSVPPGRHVFSWRYAKDAYVSEGTDSVTIDAVLAVGGTP
jgi:hypothetical protein